VVLRRQLGAAARASAVAKFDAQVFARAFSSVYESVAAAGRPASL
jgi:hypothetical protein